ncbi:glycohydrolase toxin TNT-related protein [Haloactinomyces albus]|uniref:TNT domain-containing protein n=1 Tax=Haloactinomyces albus TaxID=1352928 RepID=A0AAE3ZCW0_9ACTN|nr:glycohydrolase toxin TNT-related protein [Haloactinomyces albus]MDR7302597.1 hypothetical protein [Haloactinomyces albus]
MSRPTAISPEEQEQIARKIGVLLLQGAPEDWQQITVEYRATGDYHDLLGETARQDGSTETWEPPEDLLGIFEHLREGMYRPDVGTWISALYIVERPSSYRIDINFDEEPQWQQPLPRAAYVDELHRYPRSEENVPDWMRAKLDGSSGSGAVQSSAPQPVQPAPEDGFTGPQDAVSDADGDAVGGGSGAADGDQLFGDQPFRGRSFRTARVFDGIDEQGRPLVATRTPVPPEESGSLRQYLENAPIVLASRDNEPDRLDPEHSAVVPATWHTDGTWLWQGALPYYLAQYGLPPDPELLEHIRSGQFTLPEIDDHTRDAAVSALFDQPAPETGVETGAPDDRMSAAFREQDASGADGHGTGEYGDAFEHSAAEAPIDRRPDEPVAADDALSAPPLGDVAPEAADGPGTDDASTNGRDADELEADNLGVDGLGLEESGTDDARDADFGTGEQESWRPEPESHIEVGSVARHGRPDDDDELDASDSDLVFARLHDRLSDFGVDPDGYRIGSRADNAWCLMDEGSDWVVTGPEDSPDELRFARPEQAAAHLLGSLLMSQATSASENTRSDSPESAGSSAPDDPAEFVGSPEPAVSAEATGSTESASTTAEPHRETPALVDLPPRPSADSQHRPTEEPDGHFLFTANQPPSQEEGPSEVPESPAARDNDSAMRDEAAVGEEPTRIRQAPPMNPAPPPPAEPASGGPTTPGQGIPPLPKRQPRTDLPPAPATPPPPGGSTGADQWQSGPGVSGGVGPPHPGTPGEPPRPPQAGGPGEPPARPNGALHRPPQAGPGEPPRPPQAAPAGQVPAGQAPSGQALNGQAPQQPIEPLRGEPPLTLYRDRRTVVLQPGTDLDRFGEPSGNVTYAIRTPYTQRSLPPQWANRSYLAYRVQRPIQVLRGTAVPWFEQQGGGTAYVLPAAVGDLVANGTLIALTGNEAPPRPSMD